MKTYINSESTIASLLKIKPSRAIQLFLMVLFFIFSGNVNAQTFVGPGTDWNTASNWSPAAVPSTDISGTITINSSVTVSSIVVKNHGVLIVNSPAVLTVGTIGNSASTQVVDFQNGSKVTVNTGASMIVYGLLNNSNNSNNVKFDGAVNVTGNVTVGNGSTITGSGSLSTTGSVKGAGTVFGTGDDCDSGNGCNYGCSVNTIADTQTICSGTTAALTGNTGTGYSYQWQSSTSSSSTGFSNISGANSNDYTTSALTTTTYFRRIVTVSGCSSSNSNVIKVTVASLPAAPTNIRGWNATCNSYVAAWDGSATKFYLDVATTSTFDAGTILSAYNNLDVGNVNSLTLNGLTSGTTYYFRVRAFSSSCTSNNSSAGNFTTLSVAVPTNTRGDNNSWCSYIARWDGSATKFYLDVATSNAFSAGTILPAYNNLDVGTANSITLSGLSPNTTYYFRVRRLETCGLSGNSSVASFTTLSIPTPTANTGYANCNDWMAQWNNASVDGYYLDVATDNAFTNYVSGYQNLDVGNVIAYNLTGLSRGGTYYYRVRAKTSCGFGANSNVVTFTERGNGSSNAGTISGGAASICVGASTTFTNSGSNPSTGTWSIFNQTGTATINSSGTVTGITAGTVTVVFTVGSGCQTSTTQSLTITPGGTISSASSSPSLCINTAMTAVTHTTSGFTGISNSGVSGANGLPVGVSASFASNTVTISGTPTVSGTFNYSIPLTGGCAGANAAGTITVGAVPNNVSNGFTASTICAGGSPQLTFDAEDATFSLPYSITYKNDATSAQFTVTIPSASAYSFTPGDNPAANANYSLVSISNATCTRTSSFDDSGANLIIRPLPTASISGSATVCAGASSPNITFTNPQTVAVTVTYTINGGANQTINIPASSSSNVAVSTAASGSFVYSLASVVYQSTPGCSNTISGSATVTVNSLSTAPTGITGTTTICNGNSTTLTVSGGTAGTGAVAEWFTSSCGGTLVGTGNSITVSPSSNTTYYVRYNGACNTTACASVAVAVNPLPSAAGAISGLSTVYKGEANVSYSVGVIADAFSYSWSYTGTGAAITNNTTNSPVISFSNTAVSGILTVRGINSCGSGIVSADFPINVIAPPPPAPPTISGNSTVCQGDSGVVYSITNIVDSYNWSVPAGAVIVSGQNTNSIIVDYSLTAVSGNLTVDCTNAFGTFSGGKPITVNALPGTPLTGTVTQPTCVAAGSVVLSGLPASGTVFQTGTASNSYAITGTTMTISGLAAGNYQFSASNGNCTSDPTGSIVMNASGTKTWNGTTWSPSAPTTTDIAVINADYSTSSNGDLNACSVILNSGFTLTIEADQFVTIQNNLTVNGTLSVLDKGSLVMVNDAGIVAGTGSSIVRRFTTPYKKNDYVYWSTPVSSSAISSSASGTFPGWRTGYAYEYKNAWVGATTMTPAKGYIVMVPDPPAAAGPGPQINISEAVFKGKLNNGIYKITGVVASKSYLLGNPYASAIDADKFILQNSGVIGGTLYFWTHNTAIQLASNITNGTAGSGTYAYTSDDYASYNITGGTGTASAKSGGVAPNGKIGSGQGFFTTSKASISSTEFVFNNSMRVGASSGAGSNSQFFKTKASSSNKTAAGIEKHRIWLNLSNDKGAFKQTLLGYIGGATNANDEFFDGKTLDGNKFIDFYSVNQNTNLVIQGRALPFDDKDEVPLGYKTAVDGSFNINIEKADGLLVNQTVFLQDKLTNTEFDLKNGSYTFTTAKGTFNDRFVLKYKSAKTLATETFDAQSDQVVVSVKNKQIKISSSVETIAKILIYDVSGKQIYKNDSVKSNEFTAADFTAADQVLIVKTTLQNGAVTTDKIVY